MEYYDMTDLQGIGNFFCCNNYQILIAFSS